MPTRRPCRAQIARALADLRLLWRPPPDRDNAPVDDRGAGETVLHNKSNSTPRGEPKQRVTP